MNEDQQFAGKHYLVYKYCARMGTEEEIVSFSDKTEVGNYLLEHPFSIFDIFEKKENLFF